MGNGNDGNDSNEQRGGRFEWRLLFVLWAVFTAIGEFLALGINLLPGKYSREAHVVDEAYILLIALAVPIFALVSAALLVSITRFKVNVSGIPTEDGPAMKQHSGLFKGWIAVSAALALMITINPGFIGLSDLRGSKKADVVIKVEAQRWAWRFTYPGGEEITDELVMPVDKRIRFDVTATDILHSFWIPAFRLKIDAVPGRVTKLYATPEKTGTMEDDSALRLQCAELCGLGHAKMAVPVRILEQKEFDAKLAEVKAAAEEEAELLRQLEEGNS